MSHYYPRPVSGLDMPILRRNNCTNTASGILALLSRCTLPRYTTGVVYSRLEERGYQMLCLCSCSSWGWACQGPKHVEDSNVTHMFILKCALKLVEEIILYYDARSKKHQIKFHVNPSNGSQVVEWGRTDRQTGREAGMTKIIVFFFRNFANASKSRIIYPCLQWIVPAFQRWKTDCFLYPMDNRLFLLYQSVKCVWQNHDSLKVAAAHEYFNL